MFNIKLAQHGKKHPFFFYRSVISSWSSFNVRISLHSAVTCMDGDHVVAALISDLLLIFQEFPYTK